MYVLGRQKITKVFHALHISFIQEEISLFDSTVDLKTQPQAGILYQIHQDVMSYGLKEAALITHQLILHKFGTPYNPHVDTANAVF